MSPVPEMRRHLLIATGVILLHVFVLWARQSGLMRRAIEVIVPGEILSEFISPPLAPAPQPQTHAPQPDLHIRSDRAVCYERVALAMSQ